MADTGNFKDWAQIRRHDSLPGVDALHARYVRHGFVRHWHESFAFGVIEDGLNTFWCQGEDRFAPAGRVTLMNPGDIHDGRVGENGWRQRMFYVDPEVVKQTMTELTGKPSDMPFFKTPVIEDRELARLVYRVHQSMDEGVLPMASQSGFLWALGQLAVRYGDDAPRPQPLRTAPDRARRMREFIVDRMAEPLSLDMLAAEAGISRFYALRLFKQSFGLPPHAYQIQCRLHAAARLLVYGEPLAEIAADLGFADQSHMTRHFRNTFGVTPAVYAARQ